jgi:hypothetical protein
MERSSGNTRPDHSLSECNDERAGGGRREEIGGVEHGEDDEADEERLRSGRFGKLRHHIGHERPELTQMNSLRNARPRLEPGRTYKPKMPAGPLGVKRIGSSASFEASTASVA